jgi:uncharacterized protein YndB with AHSA1/START domain
MSRLEVRNEITIHAPAAKVWDALVNPQQTKKYMFGCEALSDWKVGSSLVWEGEYEGKKMVFVKGKIEAITPNVLLAYTVIDPNNPEMPDVPENYLLVEYFVEPLGNSSILRVVQSGFEGAARGKERYEETSNNGIGWQPILDQIKALCEN